LCILMLLACLMVPDWNSESSKLIPHSLVLAPLVLLLRFDFEAVVVEIKDLKHKLEHSSCDIVLSHPCEACVSLKGKLFYGTKENTEL
jgi:hypothetical protein